MTNASAAGRKTEKSLQADLTETVQLALDSVRDALSRTKGAAEDRDREIQHVGRLSTVASQLTNAFVKLRAEERNLW